MGILACILILAGFVAAVLFILYHVVFHCTAAQKKAPVPLPTGEQYVPYRARMAQLVQEMQGLPYEEVRIHSRDGLTLFGRYLQVCEQAPLMIQVHGYRSGAIRDFCGGNKIARENGMNTLLIDMRAHGNSDGHTLTFGIKERYDVLDWVAYASRRFGPDTKIFLSGISMGAATVLMTADLDLPRNVVGLIADCPYTSPEAIIRKVIRQKGYSDKFFFPLIRLSAMLFGKISLTESSPVQAVRRADRPILLIHGTDDRYVPFAMSEEIRAASAAPVQAEWFAGAAHGISYLTDPERYTRVVLDFVAAQLD